MATKTLNNFSGMEIKAESVKNCLDDAAFTVFDVVFTVEIQ
jgi:hypothetical protein